MAWKWKGKTVVVAINPTEQPLSLQANWKTVFGAGAAGVRVLWEKRNAAPAQETFQPFDVHIYTDAAQDKDIFRRGFDIEPIMP